MNKVDYAYSVSLAFILFFITYLYFSQFKRDAKAAVKKVTYETPVFVDAYIKDSLDSLFYKTLDSGKVFIKEGNYEKADLYLEKARAYDRVSNIIWDFEYRKQQEYFKTLNK